MFLHKHNSICRPQLCRQSLTKTTLFPNGVIMCSSLRHRVRQILILIINMCMWSSNNIQNKYSPPHQVHISIELECLLLVLLYGSAHMRVGLDILECTTCARTICERHRVWCVSQHSQNISSESLLLFSTPSSPMCNLYEPIWKKPCGFAAGAYPHAVWCLGKNLRVKPMELDNHHPLKIADQ